MSIRLNLSYAGDCMSESMPSILVDRALFLPIPRHSQLFKLCRAFGYRQLLRLPEAYQGLRTWG